VGDLVAHYTNVASKWPVRVAPEFGPLVAPNGNSERPFHGWFHLKEAFSSRLLDEVLGKIQPKPEGEFVVIDPFLGSGTSLLSATESPVLASVDLNLVGYEINPFIGLVSRAKLSAAVGDRVALRSGLRQVLPEVIARSRAQPAELLTSPSATLSNPKYFDPANVDGLLRLSRAIQAVDNATERDVLNVALGAIVESTSKLRRDGRALRYVDTKVPVEPRGAFDLKVESMIADLKPSEVAATEATRTISWTVRNETYSNVAESRDADLIVFSPPYPNNIDYTEVYKLESWVTGQWQKSGDVRDQRLRTLRSHPSVAFEEVYDYESASDSELTSALLDPIVEAVPEGRYKIQRTRTVKGYADDMLLLLRRARRDVKPNGRLVFVVANSLHGDRDNPLLLAADIIIARLGEIAGWRVSQFDVARQMKRRSTSMDLVRESVVVLAPS